MQPFHPILKKNNIYKINGVKTTKIFLLNFKIFFIINFAFSLYSIVNYTMTYSCFVLRCLKIFRLQVSVWYRIIHLDLVGVNSRNSVWSIISQTLRYFILKANSCYFRLHRAKRSGKSFWVIKHLRLARSFDICSKLFDTENRSVVFQLVYALVPLRRIKIRDIKAIDRHPAGIVRLLLPYKRRHIRSTQYTKIFSQYFCSVTFCISLDEHCPA